MRCLCAGAETTQNRYQDAYSHMLPDFGIMPDFTRFYWLARCHEYSVGGSTAVRNMKTINLLIILTLTLTLTRYKRLQFEKKVKIV